MRIRLARGDGAAGKKQCYSKEKKYDYSHKNDSIEVQVQKTLTTNPIRRCKLIHHRRYYSQPKIPIDLLTNLLTTTQVKQETPRNSRGFFCLLWYRAESNRRHKDFQSFALPTELRYQHVRLRNPKSFLPNGLQK